MQIPEQDYRNILEQTDIVSLIQHYVPLKKKGKEFVGVCPFHDDHSPSMHVSPDKQIYKCFSCGAGGNSIKFLSEIEKIPYQEAVLKAAQMIHYPLQIEPVKAAVPADPNKDLYETLRLFTLYCSYELFSQDGTAALNYLQQRKFSRDIIDTFEIGYAPGFAMVRDYLENRIGNRLNLEKTGLVRIGTEQLQPSFANRIMIPIHDPNGHPVGYTARLLPGAQGPKYLNTSGTLLYQKSSLIFNFHRAKKAARKAGRLILVEGAMDVLGLAKAGLMEGVAMLGTSLSNEQLSLIASLQVPVTVFYDQDDAGKHAAWVFAQKAREFHIPFSIVTSAPRKDPDEVFIAYGRDGVLEAVRNTSSFSAFAFEYLQTKYNLNNYEDKKQYAKDMESIIRSTLEPFEQSAAFEQLKSLTGFSFEATGAQPPVQERPYRSNRKNWKKKQPYTGRSGNRGWKQNSSYDESLYSQSEDVPLSPADNGRVQAEKSVLWAMLFHEEFLRRFQQEVGFFSDPACSRLSLYILHAYKNSEQIDPAILFEQVEEPDVRALLAELSEWPDYSDILPDFFDDAVRKIQISMLSQKIEIATLAMSQAADIKEKTALGMQKAKLVAERKKLERRNSSKEAFSA